MMEIGDRRVDGKGGAARGRGRGESYPLNHLVLIRPVEIRGERSPDRLVPHPLPMNPVGAVGARAEESRARKRELNGVSGAKEIWTCLSAEVQVPLLCFPARPSPPRPLSFSTPLHTCFLVARLPDALASTIYHVALGGPTPTAPPARTPYRLPPPPRNPIPIAFGIPHERGDLALTHHPPPCHIPLKSACVSHPLDPLSNRESILLAR